MVPQEASGCEGNSNEIAMDKNKEKIIEMWCIVFAPLAVSLFLWLIKAAFMPMCPSWVAFLPFIIQLSIMAVMFIGLLLLAWNYRRMHRRKCCGNCVHCPDDVYWKRRSRCLRDGHEFERPGRHSCKQFFGSVTKDYLGPREEEKES